MDTTQSIYKSPAGQQAIMALYNSVLERWPVPYETVDIPTQHGHTFVIVCGEPAAPPLILLHGAGTNSTMWVGDVVAYAPHYRVYAVDLLGEPGQSAPNRPAWAGPAYAEWLGDVVDALKIDKVTLVGISQGAWTTVKYAVYKPERVEKLVLLTPGGITPDKMSFLLRVVPLLLLDRWGIQQVNRILFADQPIPDEVEDVMTLIFTHFKPRLGVLPLFSDEELKHLTMPVLLLIGAKDALRDAKKIEARMAGLLPDLTTVIIPGAGHALLNTTVQIMPFLTAGNDG